MRQSRVTWENAYHHVMNRGLNKQEIFSDKIMKEKYVELIAEKSKKYGIRIFAYCIMNNHFHIVLENSSGYLSDFMKSVNGSYGQFYRKFTNSKGYVFEDRFKSKIIQTEIYLITVILYILLNPVRSGYVKSPFDYQWSSINDYFHSKPNLIIDSTLIEEFYSTIRNFSDAIMFQNFNYLNEQNSGVARYIGDNFSIKERSYDSIKKVFEDFEKKNLLKLSDFNFSTKEGKRIRNRLVILLRDCLSLSYKDIKKIKIFESIKENYLPVIYFKEKNSSKK